MNLYSWVNCSFKDDTSWWDQTLNYRSHMYKKQADNQIKQLTRINCLSSPQVMDIAKLMKAYISMIVKKRYSNCQSVSSHGSQCSAW